jgi:tetraprenyl-beta-curcumene synthase
VYRRGPSVRRTDTGPAGIAHSTDPAPLSARQLWALWGATLRELTWGLPAVAAEVRVWRRRAGAIPQASIRANALSALANKRGHTDGAAFFSILPGARDVTLLRLLVAYEIIWDFLDSVNESGATAGQVNGKQLHLALVDALDPQRPISEHYRHHPWHDDGDYLRALVEVCREAARELPAYERVRPLLVEEALRAQVLAINHDLDPACRDAGLRSWADRELPEAHEASWFELTGAASASLTVHALLALGADREYAEEDLTRARRAYFPWISAATTMLDSYVDQAEDAAHGDHSYVAHYQTPELAARRIRELIQRSLQEARALPRGERHVLIVSCMVAMYLSKDSAHTSSMRLTTGSLISSGGSLTRLLFPVLRLWRIAYAQRST